MEIEWIAFSSILGKIERRPRSIFFKRAWLHFHKYLHLRSYGIGKVIDWDQLRKAALAVLTLNHEITWDQIQFQALEACWLKIGAYQFESLSLQKGFDEWIIKKEKLFPFPEPRHPYLGMESWSSQPYGAFFLSNFTLHSRSAILYFWHLGVSLLLVWGWFDNKTFIFPRGKLSSEKMAEKRWPLPKNHSSNCHESG